MAHKYMVHCGLTHPWHVLYFCRFLFFLIADGPNCLLCCVRWDAKFSVMLIHAAPVATPRKSAKPPK